MEWFITNILIPFMQHDLLHIRAKQFSERALASLSKRRMCILRMLHNTLETTTEGLRESPTGDYGPLASDIARIIGTEKPLT